MSVTHCDPKSYDLAEHFLADDDEQDLTPEQQQQRRQSLALAIQEAVEDWKEDEAAQPVLPRLMETLFEELKEKPQP